MEKLHYPSDILVTEWGSVEVNGLPDNLRRIYSMAPRKKLGWFDRRYTVGKLADMNWSEIEAIAKAKHQHEGV